MDWFELENFALLHFESCENQDLSNKILHQYDYSVTSSFHLVHKAESM